MAVLDAILRPVASLAGWLSSVGLCGLRWALLVRYFGSGCLGL